MGKQKGNLVYHNVRMNLDNEQHRRVHMILVDLNKDVHKSVNQFFIDAADNYISRLEGKALTNEDKIKSGKCFYFSKGDMDKMRRELKDELQREMIIILTSVLTNGKIIQIPEIKAEKEKVLQNNTEENMYVDKTTIGLVSSWG